MPQHLPRLGHGLPSSCRTSRFERDGLSRIAVLGAGAMGSAAAVLLARHEDVELLVLDVDAGRAARVAERAGAEGRGFDAHAGELPSVLKDVSAVAACLPYRLNLEVMEAALAAGCHYADLGGLYHVTLKQWELDDRFRDAGLSAVMGIGSAPGITNVLARLGADRLDEGSVRSIDLVDGAIDLSEVVAPSASRIRPRRSSTSSPSRRSCSRTGC